jgi:hypothetical protein
VFSFVWRKFSSVGIGEWWDELKNGQKLKLGDAHAPQEISKRYKRQSLGMPPRHPFFIGKNQVTFQHTIFLLLHALCIFSWSILSLVFSFVCYNKWLDPNKYPLEKLPCFLFAKNTPFFTLIVQRVFSFSRTAFSFQFSPWIVFRSYYIFISRCILDLWSMLVFIKRVVSKRFEWCWKREKISYKKVVQKRACLDCGLDFCMSCLISFW